MSTDPIRDALASAELALRQGDYYNAQKQIAAARNALALDPAAGGEALLATAPVPAAGGLADLLRPYTSNSRSVSAMTDFPNEQAVAAALKLALEAHQRYLNDEPGGVRLNLRGANLAGASMTDVDMTDACMHRARMAGADMNGVDMTGACMNRACMRGARMKGADMNDANMTGASMIDVRMRGADLRGADMMDANFRRVLFYAADFRGADFRGTPFEQQAAELAALQAEPPTHDPSQS